MGDLKFTTATIESVIDGRLNSFRQDISDNNIPTPPSVTGGQEFVLVNNGANHNTVGSPAYITSRWDVVDNKIAFPEELDAPTYVVEMGFLFTPSGGSEGSVVLRVYIDTSGTQDFATDPLIRTVPQSYKGATSIAGLLTTWYLGEESGYDAKNDGVYFTLEFSTDGEISNKSMVIYRT